MGFPGGTSGKESTCQCKRHETQVQSRGQKNPLEEDMATHSCILVWRIPGTENPGGLLPVEAQKSPTRLKQLSFTHSVKISSSYE